MRGLLGMHEYVRMWSEDLEQFLLECDANWLVRRFADWMKQFSEVRIRYNAVMTAPMCLDGVRLSGARC